MNRLMNLIVGERGSRKGLTKEFLCIHMLPMDTDNRVLKAWGQVGTSLKGAMGERGEHL